MRYLHEASRVFPMGYLFSADTLQRGAFAPSNIPSYANAATLQVKAGASLVIRHLVVRNDGWVPVSLAAEESSAEGGLPEATLIRGFCFDKKACYSIRVESGTR